MADAYYRLSREDGDKAESDSIVNQKALVKEFLKSCPDITLYEEKVDDGYTGVNFERPGFQAMLEDIKSGKVNCVIVKDLSRFGRNYIEAGRYIEKIFPYLGVRFIAINDNIDTASSMDKSEEMIIPFKNLINDAYCRDISVKIRSHLDIKRRNGQYIGSFAPYGYKKSPLDKNKLIIDESAAEVVQQIFKWKLSGMSGARIADKLNELGIPTPMEYKLRNGYHYQCGYRRKAVPKWQSSSVNYILRNETYTGVLLQGKTSSPSYKIRKRTKKDKKDWIRCENSHEAIISREEFDIIHGCFDSDTRVSPEEQSLFLLSGLVKCGYCNGNMIRKTIPANGKKYVYLVCVENKNKNGCKNNKRIPLEKLEETILQLINLQIEKVFKLGQMLEMAENVPYNSYFLKKLQETIMEKELDIEKKNQYSFMLYQDYKDEVLSKEEYEDLKDYYKAEIKSLESEICKLRAECESAARNRLDQMKWIQGFIQYRGFRYLSRELLLRLVKEIRIYDKDRIEIEFQFQSEYEEALNYIKYVTAREPGEERGKTDGKEEQKG